MSTHDDSVFIRNFSLVLAGLCVIGLTAFVLAKLVNKSVPHIHSEPKQISANVAPVGAVNEGSEAVTVAGVASAAASAATPAPAAAPVADASSDPGKATYDKVCFACHAQGIAGAPKHGDVAAWEPRIAQGRDTLIKHVIDGFTGQSGMMPPRGGNPSLSDADIGAAVDYILAAVGSGGGGAAAASAADAAAPALVAAEPAVAAAEAGGKGKEIYDQVCFVCHTPGAAGAPKLGDKAAWEPRIAKGIDTLYANSLNGFMGNGTMMPPKGGRPDIVDDDVKAAVDYMVSNAK
jgi:cytochrome c5